MRKVLFLSLILAVGCGGPPKPPAAPEAEPLIVESVRPEREEVPQAPVVGTVVGGSQAPLAFSVSGPVESILVEEGQIVEAGELLIQLRTPDADIAVAEASGKLDREQRGRDYETERTTAEYSRLVEATQQQELTVRDTLRQAEARLAGSRAALRQVREGASPEAIERATAERDAAKVRRDRAVASKKFLDESFQRLNRLQTDGAVAGNRVEEARFRAEDAQRELQLAERELSSKTEILRALRAGPRKSELEEAEAKVAEAEAEVRIAQASQRMIAQKRAELRQALAASAKARSEDLAPETAQLDRAKAMAAESALVAPVSGRIQSIRVVKGQWVEKGSTVITLLAKKGVVLEATALGDALAIRSKMKFDGALRDLPRTPVRGVVQDVIPGGGPGGIGTRLRISLDRDVPIGSVVRGTVQLFERSRLWVPAGAVVREGRSSFLWVSQEGKARRKQIAVGVREGGRIEVLAGVTQEDRLIISPPRELKEDMPVRLIRSGGSASE